MAQRSITAEDLYRWQWVSDPQVSPDGQRIAFVKKIIDKETNEYRTAIWMVPTTGDIGSAYQFTTNGAAPRWSPDGSQLAFVSDRAGTLAEPNEGESGGERDKRLGKGKAQIWLIPASGGEARQLTFAKYGASDPVWSPDGGRIAFTARTGDLPDVPEHDGKKEPRSHRITRIFYRLNGAGYIYEQRSHLFTIPAAGGEATQITDGDWDDSDPAWSPDGSQIAFNSDRSEDRWRWGHSELWLMGADGSNPRKLGGDENQNYYLAAWSPDGGQIACLGSKRHDGQHDDVYLMRPDGSDVRNLTQQYFTVFSDSIGGDMRNEHGDPTPRWSPDGQTLFALGNARGAGNVYALNVADGALSEVTSGQHHVLGFSLSADCNTVGLAIGDTQQPGDIYVRWRDSGDTRRLTAVNQAVQDELLLSTPETFTFKGANDWEIEGWILKPHNFQSNMRYPMILEIHGGPNTCYGYTFHQEFQMLAAKGYVVVYTNPRGSTSYGREFAQAVEGIWGKEDYQDMMAAVDAVLARGYIDTDRLGVTGGSYGGIMTNWIVGHTDRFKAAVTQRSISHLETFFGTSDIGVWFAEMWGDPWDNREAYRFHSPLTYVQDIKTPLLIIHSDLDLRCPVSEAEQLFIALKWLRREVEFLRFEGQNHDLSRSGHPRLRVERLNAIADWFTDHIPTAPAVNASNGAEKTVTKHPTAAPVNAGPADEGNGQTNGNAKRDEAIAEAVAEHEPVIHPRVEED